MKHSKKEEQDPSANAYVRAVSRLFPLILPQELLITVLKLIEYGLGYIIIRSPHIAHILSYEGGLYVDTVSAGRFPPLSLGVAGCKPFFGNHEIPDPNPQQ